MPIYFLLHIRDEWEGLCGNHPYSCLSVIENNWDTYNVHTNINKDLVVNIRALLYGDQKAE